MPWHRHGRGSPAPPQFMCRGKCQHTPWEPLKQILTESHYIHHTPNDTPPQKWLCQWPRVQCTRVFTGLMNSMFWKLMYAIYDMIEFVMYTRIALFGNWNLNWYNISKSRSHTWTWRNVVPCRVVPTPTHWQFKLMGLVTLRLVY